MKKPNSKNIKSIIKIYGFNLSKIDMTGVIVSDCDLRKIKFRKDRNLFQKIDGKNLSGTKLPCRDYTRHNFKDVLLKNTCFPEGAKLPKGRNFFQKIRRRDISYSIMPCLDYSIYNLKNVCIKGTVFPENCVLPKEYDFFRKLKFRDIRNTILPKDTVENLHFYDLRDVKCDLSKYNLSANQLFIIYKKQEN